MYNKSSYLDVCLTAVLIAEHDVITLLISPTRDVTVPRCCVSYIFTTTEYAYLSPNFFKL